MYTPRTILCVDDDPIFLAPFTELLQMHGYRVLRAQTIASACSLLESHWVHLMVVDLSMTGDDHDRSGFDLIDAPDYAMIPKVVLTGHEGDRVALRKALRPAPDGRTPAVDFVSKFDADHVEKIIQAFNDHVHINWALQIGWSEAYPCSVAQVAALLISDQPLVEQSSERPNLQTQLAQVSLDRWADELGDLLRKHFLNHQQIVIGRLLAYNGTQCWLEVLAQNEIGRKEAQVIECGFKRQVLKNAENYHLFAPQKNLVAKAMSPVMTLRFALVAYEIAGGVAGTAQNTLEPFWHTYQRQTADEVEEIVQEFLHNLLYTCHKAQLAPFYAKTISLTEWIDQQYAKLNKSQVQLPVIIDALCQQFSDSDRLSVTQINPQELRFALDGAEPVRYANPALYPLQPTDLSDLQLVLGNCFHLNALDHLLIHSQAYCWMPDYSHVTEGACLGDYVALEMAVMRHLLADVPAQTAIRFASQLYHPTEEGITRGSPSIIEKVGMEEGGQAVEKAAQVIQLIRQRALALGEDNAVLYETILYFHALEYLATYQIGALYLPRQLLQYFYSLLIVSMLRRPLPANAVQETRPEAHSLSLEMDALNQTAHVEGKTITLSGLSWELFRYLYERSGQLCHLKEIACDVFHSSIDTLKALPDHERKRVSTAVDRLRDLIEPNPSEPKYILTVRGAGYRLEKQ